MKAKQKTPHSSHALSIYRTAVIFFYEIPTLQQAFGDFVPGRCWTDSIFSDSMFTYNKSSKYLINENLVVLPTLASTFSLLCSSFSPWMQSQRIPYRQNPVELQYLLHLVMMMMILLVMMMMMVLVTPSNDDDDDTVGNDEDSSNEKLVAPLRLPVIRTRQPQLLK